MSRAAGSPVLGCNTEWDHKGRACHIQTEDSGVGRPHVITHLFVGGGRIVVTRRTDYSACLEDDGYRDIVRELIRHQHREMLASLQKGAYDELLANSSEGAAPREEPSVDLGVIAIAAARRRNHRETTPEPGRCDVGPASSSESSHHVRAPVAPTERTPTPSSERPAVAVTIPAGQPDAAVMEIDEVIVADVIACTSPR